MPKRLCLFAHFDAQNEVKPFILHYLRELRAVCDEIIFVTVSPLPPAELAKLAPLTGRVVTKENVGYDFAMWKLVLGQVDLETHDELLLTNSSVFGPLWPLRQAFDRMAAVPCDVWGMTDNTEIDWHLQSYFLLFRRSAHQSQAFRDFWASVLPYRNKSQAIRSYEVGLSVYLKEQGLRLEPLAAMKSLPRLTLRDRVHLRARRSNPTCALPRELIAAGMPLVKVELFRDNPLDIDLRPVRRTIEERGYDLDLLVFDRPRHARALRRDRPDPRSPRRPGATW